MNEQDNNWASLLASEPPAEELAENVYSEDLHQNNTQKIAEARENIPQNINQETNNVQPDSQNIALNTNEPLTEKEATKFAKKLEQIIYYNPNSNDLNPIENAYFSLYQKAIAIYKNNLQNIEFSQIDYKIAKTLLNKDFNEEDIFKVIKENSPTNWQDEKLQEICIKKQQEAQKDEAFFEEYAHRLEAIQYVLIEDKPYTPVEKAYLETYHDMIAHIDIENTPYKDAINKNLEKNIIQTLLEKNFKSDEIFSAVEKYSPLQLETEEIQNILNPKQAKQDIEEQLATKNLATESLYTKDDIKNSINENQGNNEAIQKSIFIKIQTTYDSFIRLNRIRNFPEFMTKLSNDPKYLYLKEASKLRQLQVQNRILSNRAEIELYQKSNNDLIIASRLLEKGHTDEEIASLMVKYSPLKPSTEEINLTLKNAHILSNMEKLAQIKVEDVAIKNIAEEYILTCKKVIVDNMNNNILWNKDSESKVIKELINKGFKQDKIIPVITKFSPVKISNEEAKNLVMNTLGQGKIELSLQEFLSQNLKNKHTSEVKIVEDALKRNFPELQNKKSITKKRNFIQSELKKIKKQTQKLTR